MFPNESVETPFFPNQRCMVYRISLLCSRALVETEELEDENGESNELTSGGQLSLSRELH